MPAPGPVIPVTGRKYNLIAKRAGGKTVTVHLRPGPELEKAGVEAAEWERLVSLTGQIAEVNEAIKDATPALPQQPRTAAPDLEGQKGLCEALAAEAAVEVARLAGTVAASLAAFGRASRRRNWRPWAGRPARPWRAGRSADRRRRVPGVPDRLRDRASGGARSLPAQDRGHGPGPVTVNRAWYHCAACGHGLAPRDAEQGVAGMMMSPGLAKMAARAAEAVPFTRGAGLVGALAGIQLTGKRRPPRRSRRGFGQPPPSSKPRPPRSPPARWTRCRPRDCRTSCTQRFMPRRPLCRGGPVAARFFAPVSGPGPADLVGIITGSPGMCEQVAGGPVAAWREGGTGWGGQVPVA